MSLCRFERWFTGPWQRIGSRSCIATLSRNLVDPQRPAGGRSRGSPDGRSFDEPAAVAYAQRARGERKRPTTGWDSLTPTEVNVVRLVASGLTNKEVGQDLLMGAETVKTHLSHVYDKLGIRSRTALASEFAART